MGFNSVCCDKSVLIDRRLEFFQICHCSRAFFFLDKFRSIDEQNEIRSRPIVRRRKKSRIPSKNEKIFIVDRRIGAVEIGELEKIKILKRSIRKVFEAKRKEKLRFRLPNVTSGRESIESFPRRFEFVRFRLGNDGVNRLFEFKNRQTKTAKMKKRNVFSSRRFSFSILTVDGLSNRLIRVLINRRSDARTFSATFDNSFCYNAKFFSFSSFSASRND